MLHIAWYITAPAIGQWYLWRFWSLTSRGRKYHANVYELFLHNKRNWIHCNIIWAPWSAVSITKEFISSSLKQRNTYWLKPFSKTKSGKITYSFFVICRTKTSRYFPLVLIMAVFKLLLLLAVLSKLHVSIMVSTIGRDFIDVRKQKQLIHGPQLPDVKHYNGLRWSNSGSNLQHSCFFSPQNPLSHSLQNFRLTARILNQSTSAARQYSCLLFPQNQFCKPSYFRFHTPELSFWTHNASCSAVYLASVHRPLFFREIV